VISVLAAHERRPVLSTKKKISLSQVVTESKQKSFSHVAKTETKNRRRLRNSTGGKTSRRCEKGNRGGDTNEDALKSEHEQKIEWVSDKD
jgi:hypothetical protein